MPAAANADATPAPAPSPSLSPAPLPTAQRSGTRQAAGSPDFTSAGLCLSYNNYYDCLYYPAEHEQAYISATYYTPLEENYVRTVSGDNTFTYGTGYNGLYKGASVYCLEDINDDFVTVTNLGSAQFIVNGWAGSCTGVYDEWVAVGQWLVNVGATDYYAANIGDEYPYSQVMEAACPTNDCGIWVKESSPSGDDSDQWTYVP